MWLETIQPVGVGLKLRKKQVKRRFGEEESKVSKSMSIFSNLKFKPPFKIQFDLNAPSKGRKI